MASNFHGLSFVCSIFVFFVLLCSFVLGVQAVDGVVFFFSFSFLFKNVGCLLHDVISLESLL